MFLLQVLVTFGLGGLVAAQVGYGDRCSSVTILCDVTQFLSCQRNPNNPTSLICLCDPSTSLKHPTDNVCIPFPTEVGANCSLFPSPTSNFCRSVSNTLCDGERCVCTPDYLQLSTRCIKYSENIDDYCEHPSQCDRIEGALCHDRFPLCLCDANTYATVPAVAPQPAFCVEFATALDDPCEPTAVPPQCSTVGANVICHNDTSTTFCECAVGYFRRGGECQSLPQILGDFCPSGGNECAAVVPSSICDDVTSTCVCNSETHVTTSSREDCLPKATRLGMSCALGTVPEHCSEIPGATCNSANLTCTCDVDTHFQSGLQCSTLPTAPNESCNLDVHCTTIPNTVCLANTCQCDATNGYDLSTSSGSCWKIPDNVGGPCETTLNCRNVTETSCVTEACRCNQNFVSNPTNTSCLPVLTKLSSPCTDDVQCRSGIGGGSECTAQGTGGICSCLGGFVGHSVPLGIDRCLPIAGVNGTCQINAQCFDAMGPNAQCNLTSFTCACNSASSFYSSSCIRKIPLRSPCDISEECVVGSNANAECRDSTCACKVGRTTEFLGKCYGPTALGGPCVDQIECALSINGTVSCSTSSVCTCSRNPTLPTEDLWTCSRSTPLHYSLPLLVTFVFLGHKHLLSFLH